MPSVLMLIRIETESDGRMRSLRIWAGGRQPPGSVQRVAAPRHDLRHHFASVLLVKRVPTNVVAEYLRHSSNRLVGHPIPSAADVTRAALDTLWSDSSHTGVVALG